ncbi:MAG TPA: hypothetical protein VNO21_00625 [Polyangiaceae bacterium]|nr:hypothetical protein [Polyangiaceae bacterium]
MATIRDLLDVSSFVVSTLGLSAVPFFIVRHDERRLPPAQLERAWLPSTRIVSALVFGPLCLPVHFWRTRRTFAGFRLGYRIAGDVVVFTWFALVLLEHILDQFG